MKRCWLLVGVLTMMGLMGCATDVEDPIDPPGTPKASNPRPEQSLSAPLPEPSEPTLALGNDIEVPSQILQKPEVPRR